MKTFYPQKSETVNASKPHPDETKYKVSIGTEIWDNNPIAVIKIQMEYKGKVEGRKSPSFPIGTNDFELVTQVIEKLMKGGVDS